MADVTITPANVALYDQGTTVRLVQVAETVTAGEVGYLSGNKYAVSDCTAEATAKAEVIFLTGAGTDGYAMAAFPGKEIIIGGTVAAGTIYVLSEAGAIAPAADLTVDDYVVIVGVGTTTSRIKFDVVASGVQVA